MKARTIRQSLALAYGTARYRGLARGADLKAIERREAARLEAEKLGLAMCWHCLKGFTKGLDTCPHCQTEQLPF